MFAPLCALLLMVPAPAPGELRVFAAASLRESFEEVARGFERANPGTVVRLEFAGSQTLAVQISHGAPADVFAAASRKTLNAGLPIPSTIRELASNRITLVVRPECPVRELRDLPTAARIVIAAPAVPAGEYTQKALARTAARFGREWLAGVRRRVVSEELDVRSVLEKVRLGEADAGFVYETDAATARRDLVEVAIPGQKEFASRYWIAAVQTSKRREWANRFIRYALSPAGSSALARRGFRPPLDRVAP